MSKQAVITARVDSRIKQLVSKWCLAKGLVMARFVEDALLDKLEEYEDVVELQRLRKELTRPFREVIKEISAK